MKLHIIPESESPTLYRTAVTIPCSGALFAMLVYEWYPKLSPLADVVLNTTWYVLAYVAFALGWKICRLFILRKGAMGRNRLKITIVAGLINLLVLIAVAVFHMAI